MKRPEIGVTVPSAWSLRYQARNPPGAILDLTRMLEAKFPDYKMHTGIVGRQSNVLSAMPIHELRPNGSKEDYEEVPERVLREIVQAAFDFYRDYMNDPPTPPPPPKPIPLPAVLDEFRVEIEDLYGMLVETDLAMLMGADYFRNKESQNPNSTATFSRGTDHPTFQYQADEGKVARNLEAGGRNRILRNRSLILFLYALWEHHYRGAIADAIEQDLDSIKSDLFGDLRLYRQAIAHAKGILDRTPKVLTYVEAGHPVNLEREIDQLFRDIIGELNRLALVYFGVASEATLDKTSNAFPVALGDSWVAGPRSS